MSRYKLLLSGVFLKDIFSQKKDCDVATTETKNYENIQDINKTSLTKLFSNNTRGFATFIDDSQLLTKSQITLYDYIKGPLPLYTDIPCFWCRENFDWHPLGIPIKYISFSKSSKNYKTFKAYLRKMNIDSDSNDYFITTDIVCSFPCMKSQIKRLSNNSLFKESKTLMTQLIVKIYGKPLKVRCAPSWKLLKKWGGHMTKEEYLNTHCNLRYVITPNIQRPYLFSAGHCIEEYKAYDEFSEDIIY